MSKLHEIPVVVASAPHGPAAGIVRALLAEIESKLGALLDLGEPSTIDLRWLMAEPHTLQALGEALGAGEVSADIAGVGDSRVQETAVPCVWRVSHRDGAGRAIGEFIEITEIPELLRSDRLAVPQGLAALRDRCAQLGAL
ncbi:MAG: hydrogenase expression/formation C-terminal domain-containing protein [Candidatus Methylumidiphilus sp.]